MTEFGKIGKPEVAYYKNKKKIYFVRNLYLPKNATDKYKTIYYRYWDEVEEHLSKLEVAGKISKIFCESIYMTGEETMKVLSAMNVRLEQIVKKRTDAGGELLPLESKEIFEAYIDWYNCLAVVRTKKVYETIHKYLDEIIKERFAHIKSVLRENIADGEAALLVMRDEDRELLEVPDDIELFFATPPAYDDLLQFIRDRDSGKEAWRV
ncbi:MAG: hypothetical protein HY757_00740 [Nitrospirae bacterium]|nr:hypothetical protein [Nitrospirota bacterium]